MAFTVLDGNNTSQTFVTNTYSGNLMSVVNLGDPVTSNAANVLMNGSKGVLSVALCAQPAGGSPIPYFNDAVAGTKQQVKATIGNLYTLSLVNTVAATSYLQIFFLPSASVTLGTTVADMTIRLLTSAALNLSFLHPIGTLKSDGVTPGSGITMGGTTTATGLTGAAISVAATYS